jgi:hypothetical protein
VKENASDNEKNQNVSKKISVNRSKNTNDEEKIVSDN